RLTARYAALCRRFGGSPAPLLLTAEATGTPLLVGGAPPAGLLSPSLGGQCTLAAPELMLARGPAHPKPAAPALARGATAARDRFVVHPLVWLADREWRLAQEMACDEMAVRVTKSPAADYGEVLLKLAAQRPTRAHRGRVTVGALESPQMLRRRLIGMR